MDSRDGASEQPDCHTGADWSLDWAHDKDLEKKTRYARHSEYDGWASRKKGAIWTTVTVGVQGSAIETAWEDRPNKLRINNAKTRDVIRRQAIRKTFELSDVILRQLATHTSPERALQAKSNDMGLAGSGGGGGGGEGGRGGVVKDGEREVGSPPTLLLFRIAVIKNARTKDHTYTEHCRHSD